MWDKNKHSKDKIIAGTEYFLGDVYEKEEHTHWVQLDYKGKKAAELNVEFKFVTHDDGSKVAYAAVASIGSGAGFAYNPTPLAQPPVVQPGPAPYRPAHIMQSPIYQAFASYRPPAAAPVAPSPMMGGSMAPPGYI